MEWWHAFRRFRRVFFAFIAIVCLGWAAVLSVYLAREWKHFDLIQRTIVLAMIAVNGLSSLLLYLMIVVVFKVWLDLARVLFLLAIHAGSAVAYTLFRKKFSCSIFKSQATCEEVSIIFFATGWALAGLFVGYAAILCLMSRVPRPLPLITPNPLLTSESSSPRDSRASVSSTTQLLRSTLTGTLEKYERPTSPASVYSQDERPRSQLKQLHLLSGLPSSPRPPSQQHRRDMSYGATRGPSPAQGPYATWPRSASPAMSTNSSVYSLPAQPAQRPSLGTEVRQVRQMSPAPSQTSRRSPALRPPMIDPFLDQSGLDNVPDTARAELNFPSTAGTSSTATLREHLNRGGSPRMERGMANPAQARSGSPYSPPRGLPYQLQPGPMGAFGMQAGSPYMQHPGAVAWYYNTYPAYMSAARTLNVPSRTHTATPNSIHSVAPSIHFTEHHGARQPPPAHVRAASDPMQRPHTAHPRLEPDIPLPNPFAMVATGDIRRYGSVPNEKAFEQGTVYPQTESVRNLAHMRPQYGPVGFPPAGPYVRERVAYQPQQWGPPSRMPERRRPSM
ncbi:hypothetical protein OBBRIDRAFT_788767 [Obba rivulosa]|uniref:Uncharacterized protein n=1 Tax=Obba rivulosa TaxID=1052685 RepID=A0A8E2J5I5_9APHY|nr:hypothetical protein OBBRIDRAFT_788767 [Obba rivulosa]